MQTEQPLLEPSELEKRGQFELRKEEFLRAYFEPNAAYYLKTYRKWKEQDKHTFNIGAFFFGFIWAAWRKNFSFMWLLGGLVVLRFLLEGFLESITGTGGSVVVSALGGIYGLGLWIWSGMYANNYYFKQVDKELEALLLSHDAISLNLQGEEILRAKGGRNVGYGVLAFLAAALIGFISVWMSTEALL